MKDYEDFKKELAFDEMLFEIKKTLKEFNFEQIKRLAKVNECEAFIEDDINKLFDFHQEDIGFIFGSMIGDIKSQYRIKGVDV